MTYSPRIRDFVPPAATPVAPRHGLLRRAFDAVFESRRRSAERDVARFVARSGGRLTDDIERRITERLINSDWNFRR
jgi:hypothetical protein